MKKTQLISLILVGLLLAGCQTIKVDLDSVTPISPDYSYGMVSSKTTFQRYPSNPKS